MKTLLVACCLLFGSAYAQDDPFIGTWTMNLKQSKYASNDLPQRMTIVMDAADSGIHYQSEITHKNGAVTKSEYTADYDGAMTMVLGSSGVMAPIALKRIDDHTTEASYMQGLKIVATSRRVVSKNGSTMTIVTKFKDKSGKDVTNVGVYDRIER